MSLNVLEIGPGINPSTYAFDNRVQYIGVDPDMHYRVAAGFDGLMARVAAERNDLLGFTYKHGQLISDVLEDVAATQDIVVMANVLGDRESYRNGYSGYFVDPETGTTRQTGIRKPIELIGQGLTCLKAGGLLVVIEDAVRSGNIIDHKTPEEFTEIINQDESIRKLIGSYAIHRDMAYLEKVRTYYTYIPEEPTDNYFDTCFVAELERATD